MNLIPQARHMGADIMGIIASSLKFRYDLTPSDRGSRENLRENVKIARDHKVVLAWRTTSTIHLRFKKSWSGWFRFA